MNLCCQLGLNSITIETMENGEWCCDRVTLSTVCQGANPIGLQAHVYRSSHLQHIPIGNLYVRLFRISAEPERAMQASDSVPGPRSCSIASHTDKLRVNRHPFEA